MALTLPVTGLVAQRMTTCITQSLFHFSSLSTIIGGSTRVLVKSRIISEIVAQEEVGIHGRDGVVSDFRALRGVLAVVRLETVVILEVSFSTNWLLGDLLVVVAVKLGLTGLELGVRLIAVGLVAGVANNV